MRRNGNFITKWGTNGTGNGQFIGPEGVALDFSSGKVYVADLHTSINQSLTVYSDRVQKFDSNGNFIKWGSGGTGDGQFSNPIGIAAVLQAMCM